MDARKEGREINIFIPWGRHERQGCEVGVIYVRIGCGDSRRGRKYRRGEDCVWQSRASFHKEVAQFREPLCSSEDAEALSDVSRQ